MSRPAGIPLLSGPPPSHSGPDQKACRKCGREFTLLFHRQHKCMHCGFGYCSSCTDYQALMPRGGFARGYDLAPVCAYCIELLNVTSLGRAQLRALPIAKLRRYVAAYNIPVKNPVDKNDFVDAAIAARTPQGCLSPANEDFYRKHSVPLFSTHTPSPSSTNRNTSTTGSLNANTRSDRPFPRPDLDPNRLHPQETAYDAYTPRPRTASAPPAQGPASASDISRPTSTNGHSSSHSQSAPALPPPPMSTLVTLPRSSLSALSVGTLKQIFFEARVRVPPGVVEKEELVERAWALIEEEKRKDNEGIDTDPQMDEDEMGSVGEPDREEAFVVEMVDPEAETHMDTEHVEDASSTKSKPRFHPKPTSVERSGLCVICQDEEASIAVVDCGHLCMCRECSDLVLSSSRECPLCRTRIVTEARLLRIFRT